MFSEVTPGLILNETFRIPQESFYISLMFRMNVG